MSQADLGVRGLLALVPLSAISTVGALAVFRRFSDRKAIGRSADLILAHLMELGLFFNEPALVLRAQRDLLRENLRLLRHIALPCALLAVPFTILFLEMNTVFGAAPLAVGAPAIVTLDADDPAAVLEAPAGIQVETPGVRVAFSHEVSWRIRPIERVRGRLKIASAGWVLGEPVFAGTGLVFAPGFPQSPIRIRYPRANILGLNWFLWYVLASAITALVWRAC